MLGGKSRLNILDTHVKKPKYSILQVRLLCGWLNSLSIWQTDIEIGNLHAVFSSGLFLIELVKHFDSGAKFVNINTTVLHMKPAIENLEQVLSYILRSKRIRSKR
jgi:hypothetical protein